jgi:hypothetical protein
VWLPVAPCCSLWLPVRLRPAFQDALAAFQEGVAVVACVHLWPRVAPFVFMWFCGLSVWPPVAPCGSLWLPVAPCGSLWLPVAPCGPLWLPVAPCGSLEKYQANHMRAYVYIYIYIYLYISIYVYRGPGSGPWRIDLLTGFQTDRHTYTL